MKATITCDTEYTQDVLYYLLSLGLANVTQSELEKLGVPKSGDRVDLTYLIDKPSPIQLEIKIAEPSKKTKKKKADGNPILFAARDVESGKLVSDLTNPRRKYWDREGNARSAINSYNRAENYYGRRRANHGEVELVKFELVEVPVNEG